MQQLLSCDLQIFYDADWLRDSQTIFPKPFNMKFDCRTNFILDLLQRLSGSHATGQIGNIGGIIVFCFLDDDGVTHGVLL